ncbi:MAG TPA: hypothetical protein VFJ12_16545 [Segeticoccus sp.]|nr:hypothetical protein [Segeticoccus sp.]
MKFPWRAVTSTRFGPAEADALPLADGAAEAGGVPLGLGGAVDVAVGVGVEAAPDGVAVDDPPCPEAVLQPATRAVPRTSVVRAPVRRGRRASMPVILQTRVGPAREVARRDFAPRGPAGVSYRRQRADRM